MSPGPRRVTVSSSALLLAALLCSSGCRPSPAPPRAAAGQRPDVVLVSIDSLRPDHLGAYGSKAPTSPHIDALAKRGVLFRNAVSTTSWTLPAHAAMFTGLYDSAHGVFDNGRRLAESHETLAEALKRAGYRTAGFFGGPYLHPVFGLHQGFDTWDSCMSPLLSAFDEQRILNGRNGPGRFSHADITGPRTVEKVHAWLETLDERPFFLFVHLWDVHYDYIPPAPWADMFDPDYVGTVNAEQFAFSPSIHAGMDPRDLRHVLALYDGEIAFTDHNLGLILSDLERRGRLDDAIVIVTADHGEEFFEHGDKGHQNTLFDEVVRVPLIVSWGDRLRAGSTVDTQVRLVDLLPTVLAMTGVPVPGPVSGRDISPLLSGGRLDEEPTLCELLVNRRDLRAMRTRERKLVAERGSSDLYDLAADPDELHPLDSSPPHGDAERTELARLLAAARTLARNEASGEDAAEAVPDARLRERLESLGYAGGPSR